MHFVVLPVFVLFLDVWSASACRRAAGDETESMMMKIDMKMKMGVVCESDICMALLIFNAI